MQPSARPLTASIVTLPAVRKYTISIVDENVSEYGWKILMNCHFPWNGRAAPRNWHDTMSCAAKVVILREARHGYIACKEVVSGVVENINRIMSVFRQN